MTTRLIAAGILGLVIGRWFWPILWIIRDEYDQRKWK